MPDIAVEGVFLDAIRLGEVHLLNFLEIEQRLGRASTLGISNCMGGSQSPLSLLYTYTATASCFKLFRHAIWLALALACASAGRSMEARIAIIEMTTRSSINVNPPSRRVDRKQAFRLIAFLQPRRSLISSDFIIASLSIARDEPAP
jgi:hypothetical protein